MSDGQLASPGTAGPTTNEFNVNAFLFFFFPSVKKGRKMTGQRISTAGLECLFVEFSALLFLKKRQTTSADLTAAVCSLFAIGAAVSHLKFSAESPVVERAVLLLLLLLFFSRFLGVKKEVQGLFPLFSYWPGRSALFLRTTTTSFQCVVVVCAPACT